MKYTSNITYINWQLPDDVSMQLGLKRKLSGAKSREQSDSGNGRLYDSKLARFLSPDPVLQDPSNTQNFNRYSYCLNNPFKYTDPSGYAYYEDELRLYNEYMIMAETNRLLLLEANDDASFALEQIRPDFEMGKGIDNDGNPYSFNSMKFKNGSSYEYREYANGTTYNMTNMAGMENTIDNRYSYAAMNYADTDEGKMQARHGTNVGGMSYGGDPKKKGNAISLTFKWVIDPLAFSFGTYSSLKYESRLFGGGYWRGVNGKYYSMSILKNEAKALGAYIGSANIAKNSVKWTGRFGKGLGIVSTVYTGVQFAQDPTFMNGMELGVSLASMAFWEVGAVYYAGKLYYQGAINYSKTMFENGLVPGRDDYFIWK